MSVTVFQGYTSYPTTYTLPTSTEINYSISKEQIQEIEDYIKSFPDSKNIQAIIDKIRNNGTEWNYTTYIAGT